MISINDPTPNHCRSPFHPRETLTGTMPAGKATGIANTIHYVVTNPAFADAGSRVC
ncbi:hypothetical protein KCP77_13860 [Salmonella enterica subsp. enterica]|nr:hypothetical protein KCP77_13860 [Salmonella enterica subsp. enterica]